MVVQSFKSKDLSEIESNICVNVPKEESVQIIPITNKKSVLCDSLYKIGIKVFVCIAFIVNVIILLNAINKNNTIKNLQTQLDLLQHDVSALKYRFIDDNLLKEMSKFQLESYAEEPEDYDLDKDFSDYDEINRDKREVMAATLDGVPIITETYAEHKRRNMTLTASSNNDQSTPATTTSERLRLYESLGKYTPVQHPDKQRTFHMSWTTRTSMRNTGTKSTVTPVISRTSRVMDTDKNKTKLSRKIIKKSLVKSSPNLQEHIEGATVTERRPHRHAKNSARRSSLVEASDLFAAHFHGNTSHLHEGHKGYRGNGHVSHESGRYVHWTPTSWIRTNAIQLNQGDVIVREPGLYFVYAQIYYVDEHDINGFEIKHNNDVLAQCVTMTHSDRRIDKRNTCWTGTLVALSDGDRISIRDIETNRYAYLTHGTSFFGLIKLADLNTNTQATTRQPIK